MPASPARHRCLRLLLLALLAIGVVLQPVVAAACGIADAAQAASVVVGDGATAIDVDGIDAPGIAGDVADVPVGDDCCASGDCVDCCLHAVAHPAAPLSLAASIHPASPVMRIAHAPPPRAWPVDIRPPIQG